jgi:diketogulonate reductase-like aldo/keto reductase
MVLVKNDINATWRAIEKLVDAGKTRNIGLSNFNCQHIRQVLSIARIRPTSLQVECHPHLSQTKLLRFVREAGIRMSGERLSMVIIICLRLISRISNTNLFSCVLVFSPMGGTSYISLGMATESDLLFEHPVILGISQKYNKSWAQVLLRWAVQRNTLPISKSSSLARMEENRSLFDFYLSKEDMIAIDGLNKNRRYNDPGDFCEPGMGTFCPIYE